MASLAHCLRCECGGGWKAITITNIPEPTTMLLLAVGGTMLLGRRRAG
ncbi:MAG: PEP-CTERM sorting domain-containing protein [Phycisphaerales bacterium]|nr:PEP-CTERM sorting domain-containing protein [Phycisphaerales bacterium]